MLRSFSLVASLFSAGTTFAGSQTLPYFAEEPIRIYGLTDIGHGGMVALDLDGDGRAELVTDALSGTFVAHALLVVIGQTEEGLRVVHGQIISYDNRPSRILSWIHGGQAHLVTVDRSGMVRDYLGLPPVQQHQFQAAGSVLSAAIGDVDADDRDELVVLTEQGIHRYDLESGAFEHTYTAASEYFSDIALAQLDADPALEIILSGQAGWVLDGATSAVEWTSIAGAGEQVVSGRFGDGGAPQWVTADWQSFSVFAPWEFHWGHSTPKPIGAIGSVKHGEEDWIVVGTSSGLQVYEAARQTLRFEVPNYGFPVQSIASGDLDGDGTNEIAFGFIDLYSSDPDITVIEATDGTIKSHLALSPAPYELTAIGDIDGNGRLEIVAATTGYTGTLEVFDLSSGRSLWRKFYSQLASGNLLGSVNTMALAKRNGHPGLDIVLAGGRVLAIDGLTRETRVTTGPPYPYYISDMVVVDYDQDGIEDFAVAAATAHSSGSVIRVFSGRDGAPLWTSVEMGGAFNRIRQVLAIGGDAAHPRRQLVAVMPDSFRFYDAQTGLLDWVLPTDSDQAIYIPQGEQGAEIAALRQDGALTFHSLATRLPVRQYSLPSPLRSLYPLGGDLGQLVAMAGDQLVLLDGLTGTIAARSEDLIPPATGLVRMAASQRSNSVWQLAAGSGIGLYRPRLVLSDAIFADGLDKP